MNKNIFFIILLLILLVYIYYLTNRKTINSKYEDIRKLTRQCSRWLIASQQDESPLIATLHVQYGMGYLWALKDISTMEEFKIATGLDFLKFENKAVMIQDEVSKKIIKVCPQFSGDIDKYLGVIAGEL
jgi:hypothetical protein